MRLPANGGREENSPGCSQTFPPRYGNSGINHTVRLLLTHLSVFDERERIS
jgi:hypothetical protein